MDLVLLKQKINEYFTDAEAEYSSDILKSNDDDLLNFSTHVTFNELGNHIAHLNVIVYSNGISQIAFNFGKCKVNDDILIEILKYNIKTFAFKPVVEYDELRFYNQGFFDDPDGFMFNLTKTIAMFLTNRNIEALKKFAKFLK